jgi:hypothetical protein
MLILFDISKPINELKHVVPNYMERKKINNNKLLEDWVNKFIICYICILDTLTYIYWEEKKKKTNLCINNKCWMKIIFIKLWITL